LMKGIGKGMREFKDAKQNLTGEFEKGMQDTDKTKTPPSQSTTAA
jgi:Sec-independent protein translocase protein TatA